MFSLEFGVPGFLSLLITNLGRGGIQIHIQIFFVLLIFHYFIFEFITDIFSYSRGGGG